LDGILGLLVFKSDLDFLEEKHGWLMVAAEEISERGWRSTGFGVTAGV
jgi:hypothetical protein